MRYGWILFKGKLPLRIVEIFKIKLLLFTAVQYHLYIRRELLRYHIFASEDTTLTNIFYLNQVAGALALIIVDDGTCKSFDQSCVPGSSQPEGFAASDLESAWYLSELVQNPPLITFTDLYVLSGTHSEFLFF